MRVIFLRKRYVFSGIIIFIILLLSGIFLFNFWGTRETTPTLVEPIYQGKTDEPHVSLTINVDWGEDIVPKMLEVLEAKNVQATFFITGRFAEKFPEIVRQIDAQGQEIGNHGYSHPHPDRLTVQQNMEEIKKTEEILRKLINKEIFLFAPPYGERGPNCLKAAENLGYKTILWTADTIDWQEPPPSVDTLVKRVTEKKLTNGTIILMHPKSHTLEALPIIIDVIRAKGYEFKKVSEII